MQILRVDKKGATITVKGPLSFVKVIDKKGRTEYERIFQKLVKEANFNLPNEGIYQLITDGKGAIMGTLKKNIAPFLMPSPQRNLPKKVSFARFDSNKSPAKVNVRTGTIYTSQMFDNLEPYQKRFILDHEVGHLFFDSENFADLYATKSQLDKGYNLTQCLNTLRKVLTASPERIQRIRYIFDKVNN